MAGAAALGHWHCAIEHPPQQGYRPGRMHRRGCEVAGGHDPKSTPQDCKACRRIYGRPPKGAKTVQADVRHYDCALAKWEHEPPLKPYARGGHQDGCPTKSHHEGGAGLACPGCRAWYTGRDDAVLAIGRWNDDPHWACAIPQEEHTIWPGKGYGHRVGCAVAAGHTADVTIKGCLACRKARYKSTARPTFLRKHYAMTPEEYEALLLAQGGVCAICRQAPTEGKHLSVDHSHVTNENRGLLCGSCNLGLGYFHDRKESLLTAVEYLRLANA